LKTRQKRAKQIAIKLKELFPDKSGTELFYSNPWELLVAVILSAQSRDVKVNQITPELFKKYPKIRDIAQASVEEIDEAIKSINFHNTKAKRIHTAANIITEKFKERVPDSMDELLTLPGVARKTANVVLSNAFGKNEGIAVDTHVKRFSIRFDLTDHTDPVKIENDLMQLLPQEEWFSFHNNLIYYGREICPARPHDCKEHPLTLIYPPAVDIWPKN